VCVALTCVLLAACSGKISNVGPESESAAAARRHANGDPESADDSIANGKSSGKNAGDKSNAGADGDEGSSSSPGNATAGDLSFACDASSQAPVASLRRLTMTQYQNSVRDLVGWALADEASSQAVMDELAPTLAAVPADVREAVPQDLHGSYRRLDQSLQQNHVDAMYAASVAIGAALSKPDRLARVAGDCATDADAGNDADCLTGFIERFGARVLRHPLEADEIEFYASVYGDDSTADPAAYADLIGVLMSAPESVYFVEHGAEEVADQAGTYALTAHELASRLSYQIWQTLPDDELLAAADDGSLLDPSVYAAQVDRMLEDPRARPALDEFFADWMKVEALPDLDLKKNDPIFAAFAGEDMPGPTLRQAMIDDVLGMLDYYTWQDPADVATLFTSESSFATDPALAKIYGVEAWDGQSEPPAFPSGQRPGLLTRALFLSSGSANTRPIMKGIFIRKQILCDEIGPPPPGANAKPPELRSDMTTRQVVEELTQKEGTVCTGCHTTVINPLGFASENFDALGRLRSEQRLFDESGKEVGEQVVDTHSVPHVLTDDDTPSAGMGDLMPMIAESGKAEACLARNYFRFTYARWDDPSADGCALETQRQALMDGGSILDLVRATAMAPEFARRRFE
jgi:hypothetical protein